MPDEKTRKAFIFQNSILNGEEQSFRYIGEYRMTEGSHVIAYRDYTGNMETRVGLEVTPEKMLVHRVGKITSDMLFDPEAETLMRYDALYVNHTFRLHTDCYRLEQEGDTLRIDLKYRLFDSETEPPITGVQKIKICLK